MGNSESKLTRGDGRIPLDLLADSTDDVKIKKYTIGSLLVAALFIIFLIYVFINTSISQRHTIRLLHDTFSLHNSLQNIDHQVAVLFANQMESDENIDRYKEVLKANMEQAIINEADMKEDLEIKRLSVISPVTETIRSDFSNKKMDATFREYYFKLNQILGSNRQQLIQQSIAWRQQISADDNNITYQYQKFLTELETAAEKELRLYNFIQIAVLSSVGLLLFYLWFSVYRPLMKRLKEQHFNVVSSYYDVHYKARTDDLTKLANRLGFNENIARLFDRRENSSLFTLVIVDINQFKMINDRYGHSAGDEVLISFADHLATNFVDAICIARLGGDEFALLLNNNSYANLEDLIKTITRPISVRVAPDKVIKSSVSAGAAIYGDDGVDQKTLLIEADRSLYINKNANKRGPTQSDRYVLPADIQNSIELGVKKNEFYTVFQPIVTLSGEFKALESLVRWRNPDFDEIPISLWFKAAEVSNAAVNITHRVLKDSINAYKVLSSYHYESICFNLNVSGPMETVYLCLEKIIAGLENEQEFSRHLYIEFTESIDFFSHEKRFDQLTKHLSNLGVRFSFDDFGTGYATLLNLLHVPVNQIKIDQQFIRNLDDELTFELVNGMVGLSNSLGIDIVAEGVERADQLEKLKLMGGKLLFQGNIISKPQEIDNIVDWLRTLPKITEPKKRGALL